jgi:hypothetical protein
VPGLDATVPAMLERTDKSMQDASGLNSATATGEAPASVTSGTQMQLLVEETRVGLSALVQGANRYMVTNWQILLVLIRAFYDTPRQLAMGGEGADTQQRAFMGVDLLGAGDIEITKGTGTMLSPTAKTQSARDELDLASKLGDRGGIERYHRAISGNQSALLGIEDDPHRARIDRQIGAWKDAARQQHPPAPPADPTASPVGMSPDGQMIPAPPPPDPVVEAAHAVFQPNPTDDMPDVAPLRYAALSDLLASKAFTTGDPRFQAVAADEFLRMKAAAGIQTIAEQQAAQQQAAQAQQQAQQQAEQIHEQAKVQAAGAQQTAKLQAAQQGADQAHAHKLEQMQMQAALQPPQPTGP